MFILRVVRICRIQSMNEYMKKKKNVYKYAFMRLTDRTMHAHNVHSLDAHRAKSQVSFDFVVIAVVVFMSRT